MALDLVFPDCDPPTEALFRADGLVGRLAALGPLRIVHGEPADEDDLVARIGAADAVLLGWNLRAGAIARLPAVQLVCFAGTGAATFVDLPAATRAGIAVANTPGYADATVAEHAFALLLAVARHIPLFDARLRAGVWDPEPEGIDLAGATLGLVGYGGIARRVAALAQGFGMEVIAWTRSRDSGTDGAVRFAPLNEVLAGADVVSLHLAYTADTHGLIDAAAFARMKPGAILVNTARAAITDEAALAAALAGGRLAGAGIDVFGREPMAPDHPLRGLPNVVLTPHVGYKTRAAQRRLFAMMVDNVLAFFAGAPRNIVNPEVLRR